MFVENAIVCLEFIWTFTVALMTVVKTVVNSERSLPEICPKKRKSLPALFPLFLG
jgi:hypothetical protein